MSNLRCSLMLLALYVCGGQTDPAPLDEININLNLMDNDMVGPKENENMETGMANMEEGTENGMESGAEHYPKPTWEPSSTVYCAHGGQSTDPSSGGKKCNLDDGHFCCALKCCPPNTRCGPTSDGTCVHTETGMANMEEDRGNMESGEEHYPKPTWEPSSTVYCAHGGQSTDPSSGGTKCNLDNGHFCCALKCCPPNTRCGWTVNGTCIHDKPITWHQRNENMDSGMANMETGMANMEEDSGKKKPTWEPTWDQSNIVYCNGAEGPSTDPSSGGTKCNLDDGHFCCDKQCCAPNMLCILTKPGKCVPDNKPTWYHR